VLFTVQKALPLMRDGSSIIITSTIASLKGFPGRTAYAAAKAGLRAFARVWTTELKDRKIRTNLLTPGPVNTPQIARLPREAINRVVPSVPLGRIAEVEEIANAALFLASDESGLCRGKRTIRRRRRRPGLIKGLSPDFLVTQTPDVPQYWKALRKESESVSRLSGGRKAASDFLARNF
jgi:NAD(P)-dependent dehydrogenase (short-subunit alcohol dehydrogenase family)